MQKSYYFDYNATTPVDPRVFDAMRPYFESHFGNPASQLHQKGWEAKTACDVAREKVAKLIHATPDEIAFTGGSTESNNWALKGLIAFLKEENPQSPLHVLTSNVEHASVREPLLYLKNHAGLEVDFLPVDKKGFITVEQLEKARKPHTKILSLIWVHNEIGIIQNMKAIAEWALQHGIYLHTDATQAVGKIEVNVQEVPVSLLSFSGHKLYGPKGIGALYIRRLNPKVILRPLLHGGGQEKLGRSGTLNVPGIVGLGEACALAEKEMQLDYARVLDLMENFWTQFKSEFPRARLNGPDVGTRTAFNLNFTLPGVQSFQLMPLIPDLCLSGGSACNSGNLQGNPVLLALGHNPDDPSVSLRMSAGRMSSREDFDGALTSLRKALKLLDFQSLPKDSHGLTTVLE
jgi:cysteine desulfurase